MMADDDEEVKRRGNRKEKIYREKGEATEAKGRLRKGKTFWWDRQERGEGAMYRELYNTAVLWPYTSRPASHRRRLQ